MNALTCDADGTRNRGRRCRRQMTVYEAAKPPFGPAFSLFEARLCATDLSDKGFCRVCVCVCTRALAPSLILCSLRPSILSFFSFFILPANPLMQMLIRDSPFSHRAKSRFTRFINHSQRIIPRAMYIPRRVRLSRVCTTRDFKSQSGASS